MAKRKLEVTEAPSREPAKLSCLVVKHTADGFVVGHGAIADDSSIEWLSPTHVREWTETRPKDVVLSSEKWANEDGTVTLKPKRVAKGVPQAVVVGMHSVFGELMDSAAHRAKSELKRLFLELSKGRKVYWRHLCASQLLRDLPTWSATPRGEACPHCGAVESKPKASAA